MRGIGNLTERIKCARFGAPFVCHERIRLVLNARRPGWDGLAVASAQ